MRFPAGLLAACVLVAVPASAAKIVVFPPTPGPGLSAREAAVLTDAVAAAASRAGHDVVTPEQLQTLLGLDAFKQLAGCDAGSCVSEVGDALGADAVVNVSVGTAGQSVLVTLKRTDTKGGTGKVADRRLKKNKGAIDAVLDALPGLVGEALGGLPTTTAPTTSTATTTTTAPTTTAPTPPMLKTAKAKAPRADTPIPTPKGLTFVEGEGGKLIAFVAAAPNDHPLYAGTAAAMYEVHPGASSSSDGEGGFSRSFWDPRIGGGGAERSFDSRAGTVTLTCGAKTTTLSPTKKKVSPKFFAPAWRRQALLIGRDDSLRYIVVDADRAAEPVTDLHVYMGKKGKLVVLDLEVERDDSYGAGGIIAVADNVVIKLGPAGGVITEGGGKPVAITALDLWDNASMLYKDVKPWGDVQLGTPCD